MVHCIRYFKLGQLNEITTIYSTIRRRRQNVFFALAIDTKFHSTCMCKLTYDHRNDTLESSSLFFGCCFFLASLLPHFLTDQSGRHMKCTITMHLIRYAPVPVFIAAYYCYWCWCCCCQRPKVGLDAALSFSCV